MAGTYTPEADASFGLIYRLNFLWAKVDRDALSGNFNKWELVLDRIFSNLLYREEMSIEKDGEGNIIKISLCDEDKKIWEKLKSNIREVKKNMLIAQRKKSISMYHQEKTNHYQSILMYDIWVRKKMQELNLYMKESESNPSMSLFGGAFQKKGRR